MKILFYGSCNATELIKRDSRGRTPISGLSNEAECVSHQCHSVDLDTAQLDSDIRTADFIVTQPVGENYRDNYKLSTKYLLENRKSGTPVVIFPPIRFNAYYLDYSHLYVDGKVITQPEDMHLMGLYETYKRGGGADEFIDSYINNPSLFWVDKYWSRVRNDIEETAKRERKCEAFAASYEDVTPIKLTYFYRDNHKRIPLTYTANHPSKYTMTFVADLVCDAIAKKFGDRFGSSYTVDPLADPFSSDRWIIYSSIQRCVDFAVALFPPAIRNPDGSEGSIESLFDRYAQAYQTLC